MAIFIFRVGRNLFLFLFPFLDRIRDTSLHIWSSGYNKQRMLAVVARGTFSVWCKDLLIYVMQESWRRFCRVDLFQVLRDQDKREIECSQLVARGPFPIWGPILFEVPFCLRSFFSLFISISISAWGHHYLYQQFSSCYTRCSYNSGPDQIFSKTKLLLRTNIHSITCHLSQ